MLVTKKYHKEKMAELEERLASSITANSMLLDATITRMQAEIEGKSQQLFEAALAADRKKRYDSNEPYVEIVSENFTEEGGVQLRLDWNAPFIKYLKENGFSGPSDEAIVDNWIISLSRERIAEGGSEFK